jgi:hemerythrin-like domain-containing protein
MFTSGASHMCMVHNSIIRGYNSIYQQALHVVDADKANFIGYCLTWHKFVKAHTANEDNSLFPSIEDVLKDKTLWEESHKEHGMVRSFWLRVWAK